MKGPTAYLQLHSYADKENGEPGFTFRQTMRCVGETRAAGDDAGGDDGGGGAAGGGAAGGGAAGRKAAAPSQANIAVKVLKKEERK